MVSLKQAVRLLDLQDDEMVYICHEHCEPCVLPISVKSIREKYDMRKTMVKRIYAYHFRCSDAMDWELVIK